MNLETLYIRIGKHSLGFAYQDAQAGERMIFEPYSIKAGISMAANLREVVKLRPDLCSRFSDTVVLIDSKVLLIPEQEFDGEEADLLYRHAMQDVDGSVVMYNEIEDLHVVALYAVNKDTRLVVTDHFAAPKFVPIPQPVWTRLQRHQLESITRRLYAWYHDKQLEVFCYDKTRFRFCNSFSQVDSADTIYYVLSAWKQLGMDAVHDELFLLGDMPEQAQTQQNLAEYVAHVHTLSADELQASSADQPLKGFPLDLALLINNS